MALSPEKVKEYGAALFKAEKERAPIGALTDAEPGIDLSDAYAIQLEFNRLRMEGGAKIVGWKVGLTSKAMQQMLGVDQPDFGHLLDNMRVDEGQEVDTSATIWARAEPEVAFQLKADLKGPGVTAKDVTAATEYLIPSLEIIDSRIKDWKIKLLDTVSDNASCCRFVLGRSRVRPDGIDTKLIGMNFFVDGNLTGTATSAAVVGDPAEAVAWLANTLAPYGHSLKAGQIVMPGSLVAAVDVKPGSVVRADFSQIGSVEMKFK